MKYFANIFIVLFLLLQPVMSQVVIDSCNCEVDRIINTYKRLESQYVKVANNKLLYFLSSDSILSKNFLVSDSLKFKRLKIKINPILKLDYETRNFKYTENICKHFVFDTINFESVIGYYLNDSLLFFITRGHNDCDIEELAPDVNPSEWCSCENTIKQYFYVAGNPVFCETPTFDIKKDTNLVFWVDYFYFPFIIVNNKIMIYPANYEPFVKELIDKPNSFIKEIYNVQWIHYCSKRCPCGGNPWWRFWNWNLFLCRPNEYH